MAKERIRCTLSWPVHQRTTAQGQRVLRAHYPELWTELRRLDDRAIAQFGRDNPYGQFRKKESVRMLELRFDFEKEWA